MPKVIIVMFDTLCRHYLPPYGNDWVIAPNFSRLAKKTAQFENCYVGSMPCMPARREMHTGRYNFLHRSWGPLEPFDDSMPQQLKEAGVHSHKVTDHQHYWEDGGATYHTRFSTFDFVRGQEGDPWIGQVEEEVLEGQLEIVLTNSVQQKQDWINRKHMTCMEKQPQHITFTLGLEFIERNKDQDNWFLQLETFDPHEPFFTQKEFQELYPHNYSGLPFDWPPYRHVMGDEKMVRHIQCMFASLVTFCDMQLGRVLDTMDRLNLWEDTLLIVNTDHGFLMGEHDWWAKCIQPFYQEIAHIPLWIWDPRSKVQDVKRKSLVQTIDIPATILDFFELPLSPHMQGKPLGPTIANDQPVREAALFGIHGGHVNVTDGEFTYFRGCEKLDNQPLFEYTLMPMRMRSRFKPEELADAKLVTNQFSFTKGAPIMKVGARRVLITEHDTLLYNVLKDPEQAHPLSDNSREIIMIQHMLRLMMDNECPVEQYARLGLPDPNKFRNEVPFQVLQKAVRIKVKSIPYHPGRVTATTARSNAHKLDPSVVKLTRQFFTRSTHRTEKKDTVVVALELTEMPPVLAEQRGIPELRVDGKYLRDQFGRIALPRGLNVSGCCKLPIGTATHNSFLDTKSISFVGRPFPLDTAPRHFERLRTWGVGIIRLLVTWEAVEPNAPGVYDRDYLDYLKKVVMLASEYGILVIVDPHQDVWSRFTGGDGAPAWTLELVGFNISKFCETGAALTHQDFLDLDNVEAMPPMIWTTNYNKLACATMFTLFFAGNDFAPNTKIGGSTVQEFLQSHFINAMTVVAETLVGCPNLVGFDSLNEPSSGFIGIKDLTARPATFLQGPMPSPEQTFYLGGGVSCDVEVFLNMEKKPSRTLNQTQASAWKLKDIWREHGVWAMEGDKPFLKKPHYFSTLNGKPVEFNHYLTAFANCYATQLRKVLPRMLLFVEGPPTEPLRWSKDDVQNVVHAAHWYDTDLLFYKAANTHSWPAATVASLKKQMAGLVDHTAKYFPGGAPLFIGECGIPFDINAREAYHTGNFSVQRAGLDVTLQVLESQMLPFTVWNYNPDNTQAFGDQWNLEDLSVYSPEHPCECVECIAGKGSPDCIYQGGRALHALIRPYAKSLSAEPRASSFCMKQRVFKLTLKINRMTDVDPQLWKMNQVTEIFVPNFQYPDGYHVHISDGQYFKDRETQSLFWRPDLALFRPSMVAHLCLWPISELNASVYARLQSSKL